MTAAFDPDHRPRLRHTLGAESAGDEIHIHDPHRVGNMVRISPMVLEIIKHFNGEHTLGQIQAGFQVEPQILANLVAVLDESLLLDSPRFRERIGGPVRAPSCIGSYHGDPKKLRAQLRDLFTAQPRRLFLGMGTRFVEGFTFNFYSVYLLAFVATNLELPKQWALNGIMVGSFLGVVLVPVAGGLSDRFGRKPVFRIGAWAALLFAFPMAVLVQSETR